MRRNKKKIFQAKKKYLSSSRFAYLSDEGNLSFILWLKEATLINSIDRITPFGDEQGGTCAVCKYGNMIMYISLKYFKNDSGV